jgi:Phage integrase family
MEIPNCQIQRVLAIPSKRFTRTQVHFLTRPEVKALLAAPDQNTWFGRRDHAFLMVAAQTGLRLSEMTGMTRKDVMLGPGAHVRVIRKGFMECLLLHRQCGLQINLGRFHGFVAQPQCDDREVHASLQKVHGHGVAKVVNGDTFALSATD